MKHTVDQIANAAMEACFYVTPEGRWLRILYTEIDKGYFQAQDEDSGEECKITFAEVVEEENPHFEELIRIIIK